MFTQHEEIKWVLVKELRLDPRVNRDIDWPRVRRYAANFDLDKLGVIEVSVRGTGVSNGRGQTNGLFIVDGQHRCLCMLEQSDWKDQKVPCKFHRGLSIPEEAELNLGLNDYRRQTHTQKFVLRVRAKEYHAVAMNNLVRAQGWVVSTCCGDRNLVATSSMEAVFTGHGITRGEIHPGVLQDVFDTIHSAWGGTKDSLQGVILRGLGYIFLRDGHIVNKKRLVAKLSKCHGGPSGVVGTSKSLMVLYQMVQARAAAEAIVLIYNKNSQGKNLLPTWMQ